MAWINMQTQRKSMEASSDASYCERETWDDEWGSRSTLSQLEEVATHSSGRADDAATLRAERDALARALAAERARAASAARAHDARLAELHGVIAELVRRRARDKCARAIPEEEVSDECESTTQPAGELENDADHSRTDQNDTSSQLSVEPEPRLEPRPPDDSTDNSAQEPLRSDAPAAQECDSSLQLSERDSQLCLTTARCCQSARHAHAQPPAPGSAGSCDREHGSADGARVYTASPGRCSSRQAKLASRVRLRRTDDAPDTPPTADDHDQQWSSCTAAAAERLALDVCAHADLREALVSAGHDGEALWARLALWRARSARLEADCRVLHCALARATDTAHRLSCACAVQESWCVALCEALRAADRALEAYDVLLALAETTHRTAQPDQQERAAAELVARQVLGRLESPPPPALGEPLLAPGPWLQRDQQCACAAPWDSAAEARLRAHAARLKADTVALRKHQPPPGLFSYHDIEEEELPAVSAGGADMEAAVMMQEVLAAREARAAARAAELEPDASPPAQAQPARAHALRDADLPTEHKNSTGRLRRRRERHWLDAASETDL